MNLDGGKSDSCSVDVTKDGFYNITYGSKRAGTFLLHLYIPGTSHNAEIRGSPLLHQCLAR